MYCKLQQIVRLFQSVLLDVCKYYFYTSLSAKPLKYCLLTVWKSVDFRSQLVIEVLVAMVCHFSVYLSSCNC